MLDGIGARRSAQDLIAKLAETENQTESTHIRISSQAATEITDYLLTLPEPVGGYVVEGHGRLRAKEPLVDRDFRPSAASASSREGEKLFEEAGCLACHSAAGRGGWLAPRLDGIGGRRSRKYMINQIIETKRGNETDFDRTNIVTSMPAYSLSREQAGQIVDFLETLANLANSQQ